MASARALFPAAAAFGHRSKVHGGLRTACLPAARLDPRSRIDPAHRSWRNALPGSSGKQESAIGRRQAIDLPDDPHQGFAAPFAHFVVALLAILFNNLIP